MRIVTQLSRSFSLLMLDSTVRVRQLACRQLQRYGCWRSVCLVSVFSLYYSLMYFWLLTRRSDQPDYRKIYQTMIKIRTDATQRPFCIQLPFDPSFAIAEQCEAVYSKSVFPVFKNLACTVNTASQVHVKVRALVLFNAFHANVSMEENPEVPTRKCYICCTRKNALQKAVSMLTV